MDISVIIVSYNTVDLTLACLSSVFNSEKISYEVFLVDNASVDQSAEIVKNKFPSVQVIANPINRGFGAANNQVLFQCTGRYVLFLNPDTIIQPDTLSIMIGFMEKHAEVGLAGPLMRYPDQTPQDSVSMRYPGHRYGSGDLGALPGKIACVIGACQIVRIDLLREIGGFDEDFFLYGEDQDLCLRIRKHGFEIGLIQNAVILHHGGQSERETPPVDVVRKKIRAEILFYRKHYQPHTYTRLLYRIKRRAAWRIFLNRLLIWITPKNNSLRGKIHRYTAIYEETMTSYF